MKRWIRASALAACACLCACAATLPEEKKEAPPGFSLRLPIADTETMNIESQQSSGFRELPLSVADESRGRWLVLFELNYSPAKPPLPPLPTLEEGPSR